MNARRPTLLAVSCAVALASSGCTPRKSVWIYTSLYKEVIAEMAPVLKAAVPEAQVEWFQGGSETIAGKLNAELAAGGPKADLILTSDPFWYLELKKAGRLLAYESPAAREVPAEFRDPDHAFVTVRMPVLVIGYNSEAFQAKELPESWKALLSSKWKDKISMGSPLESGTSFTAVAMLNRQFGWPFFEALRRNNLVAAGGNSSVITRMETKERPVGIVLLENVLKAMDKDSPVRPIYPLDGTIPVPSPIAILAATKQPEIARKVYDWFFSPQAQNAIIHGGMYSPLPRIVSPDKARPWADLRRHLTPWTPEVLEQVYQAREAIKTKFTEIVLR